MFAVIVAGPVAAPGGGPSAAPGGVSLGYVSGAGSAPAEGRVTWTNGDVTASTEVGVFYPLNGSYVETVHTASPGATSLDTGVTGWVGPYTLGDQYGVRHLKNGLATAWVRTTDVLSTEYPDGGGA